MLKIIKTELKMRISKFMCFCIDNPIWTKIQHLNIKLNSEPVSDDKCTKSKIRTYFDQVYSKLRFILSLNFSWFLCNSQNFFSTLNNVNNNNNNNNKNSKSNNNNSSNDNNDNIRWCRMQSFDNHLH